MLQLRCLFWISEVLVVLLVVIPIARGTPVIGTKGRVPCFPIGRCEGALWCPPRRLRKCRYAGLRDA
jgi:hypothetical protein